jgi:hypothetical protein
VILDFQFVQSRDDASQILGLFGVVKFVIWPRIKKKSHIDAIAPFVIHHVELEMTFKHKK